MTDASDPALPESRDEYGQTLIFAFALGMNCTYQAFDIEDRNARRVFDVAKEVAEGNLYLGATGAEMRLKGLDVPADVERDSVQSERKMANIICHYFARLLFEGPQG